MTFVRTAVRFAALTLLFATACFTSQTVRPSTSEIIWTPRTDFGREALGRMDTVYRAIIQEVRTSSELIGLDFLKEGVKVGFKPEVPETSYHVFTLTDQTVYNTLRTSFPSRAAGVLGRRLYPLAGILNRHPALLQDERIFGYIISLGWRSTDFAADQYKLGGTWEWITVVLPYELLSDYALMKVSIQEVGRRAEFRSAMGKTEIDFSLMP